MNNSSPITTHLATSVKVLWLLLLITSAFAQQTPTGGTSQFSLHIDQRTLYTRAGYFDFRYFYRGGVPSLAQQMESYQCIQTCTNTSCALPGTIAVTGSYCIVWTVQENGADETSYGTCKCTQRGGAVCAAYTCDQSVTQYNTVCDDECFATTNTFGKVKTCTCADVPDTNATQHPYCRVYSCFGYGDGPIKSATWNCYIPASQVAGLGHTRDFCWQFGSDQQSTTAAEVKDCLCTQISDNEDFCATWFCLDRTSKKWIWWSSLLASPLAALLNLWVPFAAAHCDDCGVGGVAALWLWALVTYLLVVLLGGIPSLIANTVALFIATLIVHRGDIRKALRARKPSHQQHNVPSVVDGISLCPTCGGRWEGDAVEGRVA
ncbi:membrane-associated protein, putative [Bodo saltans]|uniref:Membrane-associated protein, putative n=1 Tax=Bodo saltans TaxID=75058 RepID=A0A0S4J333_BODSA|nr:membrane-associated protein, putative [Bodo saltans]|eukprot:CUG73196.1 membrane-associated protein, putative [Bodo saltans]